MTQPDASSRGRADNCDTIRLLAAVMVLLAHAFPLAQGNSENEPILLISNRQATAGSIAVAIFFVISGYLITRSFQARPDPVRFVTHRVLRIVPAYAVMLVIVTCVMGPIVSDLSAADYFTASETWVYLFWNLTFISPVATSLPGVFLDNPYPRAINGSLWTLPIEVECYVLVLLLGLAGLLTRFWVLVVLAIALVVPMIWLVGERATLYGCFFAGSAIWLWRPPWVGWVAAGCFAAWLGALFSSGLAIASPVFGAYALLYVAFGAPIRLPRVNRWGDLSYGTYIWAFPVQQLVALGLGSMITWYFSVLVSLPIVLLLAWLSWRAIEAPALRWKSRAGRMVPGPSPPGSGG